MAADSDSRIQDVTGEKKLAERRSIDEDDDLPPWAGTACCGGLVAIVAIIIALIYRMMPEPNAFDQTKVMRFQHDAVLRTVVWPKSGAGGETRNNGQDTDWAIFFYKPYCPACRRVWPVFRALGNSLNSTKLRFGEVDCVKDRGVCTMMGAEKHPLIRIYKAKPSSGSGGFKRETAAEWQGLLIHYEVMQWFIEQQAAGVIAKEVEFPTPEVLALEMRKVTATGRVSHETAMEKRPADPGGFLVDAELALQYGLIDHVIGGSPTSTDVVAPELEGKRMESLLKWISLQQEIFPRKKVRNKLAKLFKRLQQRPKWAAEAYEKALKGAGFDTAPVPDASWRWCKPPGAGTEFESPSPSVTPAGGYTCGLWLLFHTTIANTDRLLAPDALKGIREWVGLFFGCSHCAAHFVSYWDAAGGQHVRDHISTVLWLWKAHNSVTMRLRGDEESRGELGSSGRDKVLWPDVASCPNCYKEEVRGNSSVPSTVSTTEDAEEQWDQHHVFEFHQEVFCFESDSFVCSGFDDTSKDPELRKEFRASRKAKANGTDTAAAK